MKKRSLKVDNVLELAKKLMDAGAYIISDHAIERGKERTISIGDIINIINSGFHEKKKDEYKQEYMDWNYSIRGKTLDDESARVCIAFHQKTQFIVITVIRLEG